MKVSTFQIILTLSFLTPSLLAAPTTLNPHSPSNLLLPRYVIRCFHEITDSPYATILPSDCTKAARQILCGNNVFQEMPFSVDGGVRIPRDWKHGTCQIAIDILAEDRPTEMASLGEIATRTLELVNECVLHSKWKFGGRTTAGERDLIHIAVTGVRGGESRSRDPVRCLAP